MQHVSAALPFDADALRWLASRTDPMTIAESRWPSFWEQGREALEALFGIDRRVHFLHAPPGNFGRLREPAVTKAMHAFLTRGHRGEQRTKCQALFDAAIGASAPRIGVVEDIKADDVADRMDLAVFAQTEEGTPCCLILEAKFEAELTNDQLEKYLRLARRRVTSASQRHLYVVAPSKTAQTRLVLGRSVNKEWRYISWRRLLLNFQRALDDVPMPDATALMAEIWKRARGC